MANCYICGSYVPNGEGYRRQVQTGSGTRFYFGKRLHSSYGVYYGVRTLCQWCAIEHDKRIARMRIVSVVVLIVGALVAFYFFSSSNKTEISKEKIENITKTDITNEKINVYVKPSKKSNILDRIQASKIESKISETNYFFKIRFYQNGDLKTGYILKGDYKF